MKLPKWRAVVLPVVTVLGVLPSGGCSNTDQGIVGGGLLGATVGALAGGRKNAGAGALIGGAAGAVGGGLIGSNMDRQERRIAAAEAAAAQPVARGSLSMDDVIHMSASGTDDTLIINQIRTTGSVFVLTADDVIRLQTSRVSPRVISEMQATATRRPVAVRPVHVYEPVPVYHPCPRPVYVYPPPRPALGVGVVIR